MKIFYELKADDPNVEFIPNQKIYSTDSKEIQELKSEIFVLKYNNAHLSRKVDEKLKQKIELQNKLNKLTMKKEVE